MAATYFSIDAYMNSGIINRHGLKWGLYIGLVYAILLILRFKAGGSDMMLATAFTVGGYLVILMLLLISAFQLRKALGGYILMKDAFKGMFVSIFVFELVYIIVTQIYVRYIDPLYLKHAADAAVAFVQEQSEKLNWNQKQIDEQVQQIRQGESLPSFVDLLKTYLISVTMTGIFGLIFAFIVKRQPQRFDNFPETRDELA